MTGKSLFVVSVLPHKLYICSFLLKLCRSYRILICTGGYDRGKCLESVEEYNLLEGSWRRLADMAQCRGRFDAAVVGSKVYAVAGAFLL